VLTSFIQPVEQWLYQYFRWIPLFSTDPLATVATVCLQLSHPSNYDSADNGSISREVLLAILRSCGAAQCLWNHSLETIFGVLLPAGVSGILGAAILALGRALGKRWQ